MTSKTRQWVYGIFAGLGVVVTWYFNLEFMSQHEGFSLGAFIAATHVNAAATSIANDLMVVVLVSLFWSFLEARRLDMRHWWFFLVFTFVIAIAFTYPLFLLMRERALSKQGASA
ncbi:MAG: DUF2834 domain-containing protein [Pseudomonadota bacterium]